VADVDGVEQAHVRLDGGAAVRARARADVAVRVYEAGHDDAARGVDCLGVRGDARGTAGSDGDDLAAVDDEHAVLNLGAADGDDGRAGESHGALLSARRPGAQAQHYGEDRNAEGCHQVSLGEFFEN
jgi:hypothetical protein